MYPSTSLGEIVRGCCLLSALLLLSSSPLESASIRGSRSQSKKLSLRRRQTLPGGLKEPQAEDVRSRPSIPVIQLPLEDGEVLGPDFYHQFFPEDSLNGATRIRPIQVRVVEHEDFIDYELDFIEDDESGKLGNPSQGMPSLDEMRNTLGETATIKPTTTISFTPDASVVTFANLLERARERQRQATASNDLPSSPPTGTISPPTTPMTAVPSHSATVISRWATRKFPNDVYQRRWSRPTGRPNPIQLLPTQPYPALRRRVPIAPQRPVVFQTQPTTATTATITTPTTTTTTTMTTTTTTTTPTTTTTTPTTTTTATTTTTTTSTTTTTTTTIRITTTTSTTTTTVTTTVPTTTTTTASTTTVSPIPTSESSNFVYTNVQTVSEMVVTRNVTSTRVVTAHDFPGPVTHQPTLGLTGDLSSLSGSTTESVRPAAGQSKDEDDSTTEFAFRLEDTTFLQGAAQSRVPRIIENPAEWDGEKLAAIRSGQYHEVNPGQYYEQHPGQYHEVNPGQYYEASPGQYREITPGQYHELHPGQYSSPPLDSGVNRVARPDEDLKVEVEVEKNGDTRVYNVQSKVDEFIIGEYGTISDGHTVQGVRYTAVDDSSIDPKLIYDTLVKFFKFA